MHIIQCAHIVTQWFIQCVLLDLKIHNDQFQKRETIPYEMVKISFTKFMRKSEKCVPIELFQPLLMQLHQKHPQNFSQNLKAKIFFAEKLDGYSTQRKTVAKLK